MFDQVYREKYLHLQYQINLIRYIMKYILILFLFDNIDADIFLYEVGQTFEI